MNQEKTAANPTPSRIFTIGEYESYFLEVEIESMLGIKRSALTKTPIVQLTPYPSEGLMAFRCNAGWHIRVAAGIQSQIIKRIKKGDWEAICGHGEGLQKIFELCDWDPANCRTLASFHPKTEEEWNWLCEHDLGSACDANSFCPLDEIPPNIIRVTPDHPLWPEYFSEGLIIHSAYLAMSEGEIVGSAHARQNRGSFHDASWAIGFNVRPDHRRKGLGKALAFLATREVIQKGHIALWNTQADNPGSIRIAESLGFQPLDCRIKIPQSALG